MLVLLAGSVYAALSLDHFMAGPFLFSRPLAIGSAMGLLFGRLPEGVALGLLGESLWVVVPPAGPSHWDVGFSVALAAVWVFPFPSWSGGVPLPGWALSAAFLVAIPFAVMGRRLDAWLRRRMRLFSERALAGIARGVAGPLRAGVVLAGVVWGLKSGAMFFVAESIGGALCRAAFENIPGPVADGLSRAWRLWPALGAAAVIHQLSLRFGSARRSWFTGGSA
jgi:mannose/fructose/N-acetylgalactosamine-specific phosphotransferase system component IIC